MEAPEVPLEEVQQQIHEQVHGEHPHRPAHGSGPLQAAHARHPAPLRWTMGVALSTALFAALAAIASLLAGQRANEAMSLQLESSDQWSFFQAKSIKSEVLASKDELLLALGRPLPEKDIAKRHEYDAAKEGIREEASRLSKRSTLLLAQHESFASSVTLFQVAIALAAIAVLTQLRAFWFISLGLGAIGIGMFCLLLRPSPALVEAHAIPAGMPTPAAPDTSAPALPHQAEPGQHPS